MANDNKKGAVFVRATIRLSKELYEELQAIGAVEKRTFNNLVTEIVLPKYRDRAKIDPKYADAIKNLQSKKIST